jgi:hypothetical protein
MGRSATLANAGATSLAVPWARYAWADCGPTY